MSEVPQIHADVSRGLFWVKGEIAQALDRVRAQLDAYLEDEGDESLVTSAIRDLNELASIVEVIQCHSAGMLVREMVTTLEGVGTVAEEQREAVYSAILAGAVDLGNYVEILSQGGVDHPLIFVPIINELRVARGDRALNPIVVFARYLENQGTQVEPPPGTHRRPGMSRALAQKHGNAVQPALLVLLKGGANLQKALRLVTKASEQFASVAVAPPLYGFWVALTALASDSLESGSTFNPDVQKVLARTGAVIKHLASGGEDAVTKIAGDMLPVLLRALAAKPGGSEAFVNARRLFGFDRAGLDDAVLRELRERMGRPSVESLLTVARELRHDLAEIKDDIDLLVRAGERAGVEVSAIGEALARVAATLRVLGLDALADQAQGQVLALNRQTPTSESEWMSVAEALLRIEDGIELGLVDHRSEGGTRPEIAAPELREGLGAVLRECLVNTARVKTEVDAYLVRGEAGNLDTLAGLLSAVSSSLSVVGEALIGDRVARLRDFVTGDALRAMRGHADWADRFADALSGIEYYIEAIQEKQPNTEALLTEIDRYLDLLTETAEVQGIVGGVEAPAEEVEDASEAPSEIAAAPELLPEPAPELAVEPAPAVKAREVDEIDPELKQVFVEEAGEVIGQLQQQFPQWVNRVEDKAILGEVRRAFHTLKGSGRMVGATEFGEFGWQIERLLNGCLEGEREATPDLINIVGKAIGVLPQVLDRFVAGEPTPEIEDLIEAARVMYEGKPAEEASADEVMSLFLEDAQSELEVLRQALDSASDGQIEVTEPMVRAAHTMRGGAGAAGQEALRAFCSEIESTLAGRRVAAQPVAREALAALVDDLQSQIDALRGGATAEPGDAAREHLQALVSGTEEVAADSGLDYELIEIFSEEAVGLLEGAETGIAALRAQPQSQTAATALQRVYHTLKGSARTAGAEGMGAVAEALDAVAKDVATGHRDADGEMLQAMQQAVMVLYDMLDQYREGRDSDPAAAVEAFRQAAAAKPAGAPAAVTVPVEPVAAPEPVVPPAQVEPPEAAEPVPAPSRAVVEPVELQAPEPVEAPAPAEPVVQPEAVQPPVAVPRVEVEPPPVVAPVAVEPPAPAPPSPAVQPPAPAAMDYDAEAGPWPPDAELLEIFVAEGQELLESIDQHFAAWEQDRALVEPLRAMQRDLHTFKGGARMSGLTGLGEIAHELESVFTAAESGETAVDEGVFGRLHAALDRLIQMLDQVARDGKRPAGVDAVLADLRGEADRAPAVAEPMEAAAPTVTAPEAPAVETIEYIGDQTIARAAPLPEAVESPLWGAELEWRLQQAEQEAAVRRETARVGVEQLDRMLNEAGETSIYRARLEQQVASFTMQLQEMEQTVERVRDQLRMLENETDAQIQARTQGLQTGAQDDRYRDEYDPLEMDRYSRMQELSRTLSESVTDLVSLHGTMVDVMGETEALLLQQQRVNSSVQSGLMGTLMVPFSRQLQRLQRVVRQTAAENAKDVRVDFTGVESELDRNVLERMTPVLEHLLRNCVIHGIEASAVRTQSGKAAVGQIQVDLIREGAKLLISVKDDGGGLNFRKIRQKAERLGMLAGDAVIDDRQLAQFIFEPGFSTADTLTRDAGRGVGMDVVASEVKQLGGTLDVDSVTGKGARFAIRLPLSLAMAQALLVQVGDEVYATQLSTIEGLGRVPVAELQDMLQGRRKFAYGDEEYEVAHLGHLLGIDVTHEQERKYLPVILIHTGAGMGLAENRIALVVDQMLGNRELVTKPVGPQVSSVVGVNGATILADGRVVMILDVVALVLEQQRRKLRAEAGEIATTVRDVRPLVMVIDDSVTMRRVAERVLTRNGYRVETASDGLEGIAALQTETPDAVLLDIEMPRADGFEVATFIRNNDRLQKTPIIMITSRSGDKHRQRAAEIGVDRYMIKPYQEQQLIQELAGLLAPEGAGL